MIARDLVVGMAAVAMVFALTGCVAVEAEPAPAETATASGHPTPTGTQSSTSPSPSVVSPPVSPPASVAPGPSISEEPGPSADEELTADQAVEVCLQRYESFAPPELRAEPSGDPQTYERNVQPHWLVLIPALNGTGPMYIECRLGGPYSNPHMRGVGEIAGFLVTDEYIQRAIDENEGL